MNTDKLMKWFNPDNPHPRDHLGTALFLHAAMFMTEGVIEGLIYTDDVLWWVQGAQRSNSYGEADETYKVMKEFEEMLKEMTKNG
jgi:hypothetical protein